MSLGFTTGIRAMLSARTAMNVIGHNLANQNTPGYSRQVALLGTTIPVDGPFNSRLGTGVAVTGIQSVVNEALLSRIRTEVGLLGRFGAESAMFGNLESILGDLTDNGISAKLQGMFDSADQASTSPEDSVLKQNFLSSVDDVAYSFRTKYAAMQELRTSSLLQVDALVKDANQKFAQVAALNGQIKQLVQVGYDPGDLKDQRSVLLEQLAETVGAKATQIADGTVTVSVGSATVVTGANGGTLQAKFASDGQIQVTSGKGGFPVNPEGGQLGGVIGLIGDYLTDRLNELDGIAKELILQGNKTHATGVPADGPFSTLVSSFGVSKAAVADPYGYALKDAGLPFDVDSGTLTIAVSNLKSGDVEHHEISIDPDTDSVGDLLDKINAIPELNAFIDGVGKLHLTSTSGYGFDFSSRLDAEPVEGGTFGSEKATIITDAVPAGLTNGSQLDISVDGGAPQTVTFNTADFADITQATADEVANAINAQTTGLTASVVDGRLVVQSDTPGENSVLTVTDGAGSPNAALGLPTSGQGTPTPVTVKVTGTGSAEVAGDYTFTPVGDGTVGDGALSIEVRDKNGLLVNTLNVGQGYEPGVELEVMPGVNVSFSAGQLSGSSGQFFDLEVPGDTDTAGLLGGFGLNNLFDGTGAKDIALSARLEAHPELLSGSLGGGPGDGGNLLKLSALGTLPQSAFGGKNINQAYGGFAATIGTDAAGANSSLSASSLVFLALETQRAAESGVNPDEEFLNLERFQTMYEAAARFVSTLTELDAVLLNL